MDYLHLLIVALGSNSFVRLCMLAIALDVFLGVMASIKLKKISSTVGIDGMVRKMSMCVCLVVFMAMDLIMAFNLAFMIPETYLAQIGLEKVGICEFFALLFLCFELLSCCKNAKRLGIPFPKKFDDFLTKLLTDFTQEGE